MKKIYILLVILVIFLSSNLSFAQRGAPPGFNAMFSRMQMNMNMQMIMNMNMNRFYGSANNQKYKFKILMKDSTTKEVKSKIHMDTTLHKSYLTYEDKTIKDKRLREQRIYSNQTLRITRDDYGTDVTGMANDSCWLFKVVSGKINAYSPLSEKYDIDSFYLRAYQLGDGPVLKMDSASLAPIFAKSPKALKAFKKKDYLKAINKYNNDKD